MSHPPLFFLASPPHGCIYTCHVYCCYITVARYTSHTFKSACASRHVTLNISLLPHPMPPDHLFEACWISPFSLRNDKLPDSSVYRPHSHLSYACSSHLHSPYMCKHVHHLCSFSPSPNHYKHQPSSHNAHKACIWSVLSHSLAKHTHMNYNSVTHTFHNFCPTDRFSPLPASEFTLCVYASYLASCLAGSSMANTISGIHSGILPPTACRMAVRD